MYTAKPSQSSAYKSSPKQLTKLVLGSPNNKKTVLEHDEGEDMLSLLARVNDDSDSDDDDNDEPPIKPSHLLISEQPLDTSPTSSSTSPKEPKSHSKLTDIKLDTTMQYHLNGDNIEDSKQRVTSKAMYITSESKITHPTPLISRNRSWMMSIIQVVITFADRDMSPHKYKFENTREAAKYNTKLIKKQRYDFIRALDKDEGAMLELGSEFRLNSVLKPLL